MTLNCDLATLSACQTGVTFVEAGDELFGLQRGFLAAGARSVAASLWLADDVATAAMMEQFYSRYAQGMSKAAALRGAQRHTLRSYPHPYHWAAFVLIGER
jgi:CHAT domain-containing protein